MPCWCLHCLDKKSSFPDCDPGKIFVIFPLLYFTHHLHVDNLFMLVVRDVRVRDQVECVGPCNLFAAGFVTRTYSLAETPKFIGIQAVPNFFVAWVSSELAMLK